MMPLRLRLIVYPVFFLISLTLFCFFLFPFGTLKGRFEGQIQKALGNRWSVSVGKVSPALLFGVVLKEVVFSRPGEGDKVTLDRVRLKVGLLPLLWGTRDLRIKVKAGKGKIGGEVTLRRDETEMNLELDRWDLSLARLFLPASVPLVGRMDGSVELDLFPSDPLRNSGRVDLEIRGLRIGEGAEVKGLPLPPLILVPDKEKSRLEIEVVRGGWEFKRWKLAGGDLEMEVSGKVFPARSFGQYRLRMDGDFQTTLGVDRLPFLTLLESQKRDGKFPFTIGGRLSRPTFQLGTLEPIELDFASSKNL